MTLQPRDRKALMYLIGALVLGIAVRFWPESAGVTVVAAVVDPVSLAEKKLAKLRETAATVQAKEAAFKKLSAELADREKSIIQIETVPQAQAQLLQIMRRVTAAENPPVDVRGSELGTAKLLGDAYGEVNIAVSVECKIDQLVNILASISQQPELISLTDLRITSSNPKEKTVGARIALSAVVPKKVVPVKGKGGTAF
jgi:hypothetical protein